MNELHVFQQNLIKEIGKNILYCFVSLNLIQIDRIFV